MKHTVTVVGGGLAGSELALQLASRGVAVVLREMRPTSMTPAHTTPYLAELVCSNSLKSENPHTASGVLKNELRLLGCRLLSLAREASVPAGHALAVDRDVFARTVTEAIESDPRISLERNEQRDLDLPPISVIATGPLTTTDLAGAIREHLSHEHLHFYDAISISVGADSIDSRRMYRASRYGKGGDDYWNIPISQEEYRRLVAFLREAPKTVKHGFEEKRCFEACLPIEILADRDEDAMRFGPLRPKGLPNPQTGREPYAVLQLRQETVAETLLGLVGFQTRLTRPAQRELVKLIPGLEGAEIQRWGAIHRNTYIDSPRLLDEMQMSRKREGLFFCGQLVGVEGYMESIAHGLVVAYNLLSLLGGRRPELFPEETLIGALQRHLVLGKEPFQPMNVNFGILPQPAAAKRERKKIYLERSRASMEAFIEQVSSSHWKQN
ncbi:MAG: methylenetetrahydrofolate--tRNA-(uracil(54)-C(5))-methyltransferase (FADH(2)-oxidizing) TrmFO [bacterium]|nr:MAG: methylenetetrahydrofolate--tRNA-(uracil(54)-C(5))-methyltransferase (FADH(2)-oxidizing) TrmFO [bacterium]